jgi:hypothetical protein
MDCKQPLVEGHLGTAKDSACPDRVNLATASADVVPGSIFAVLPVLFFRILALRANRGTVPAHIFNVKPGGFLARKANMNGLRN